MNNPPPPPLPQTPQSVIPYATPVGYQQVPGGAWNDGGKLVASLNCTLPSICVKCAQPSGDYRWRKTLYWHHPAFYLMIIFPGLLIYVIVALCIRQKTVISAALCPEHRGRRRVRMAITWFVTLAGIAGVVAGFVLVSGRQTADVGGITLLAGFLVFLAGAIFGVIAVPVLKVTRINGQYAWYSGASREFLAQLPLSR